MPNHKVRTYHVANFDTFDKERFLRKVERKELANKQHYRASRNMQCRCVTGNCVHHTKKCVPTVTHGECCGSVVAYQYARSGFGVTPHGKQNTTF